MRTRSGARTKEASAPAGPDINPTRLAAILFIIDVGALGELELCWSPPGNCPLL